MTDVDQAPPEGMTCSLCDQSWDDAHRSGIAHPAFHYLAQAPPEYVRRCLGRKKPCCEHFTGRSTTDGMAQAGTDEVQCCWCGERRDRPWHVKDVSLKGHGPHSTEPRKVYDD